MMLNCHDATRLLSEGRDRDLSIKERMTLKVHVMLCASCRNFEKHMGTISRAAKAYAKRKD